MTNTRGGDRSDDATPEEVKNALALPDYRRLWINNLIYMFVSNAQRFAIGWLVLDGLGGNEIRQGMAVFMLGVPVAFIVMQAGALADRVDRRSLLIRSQAGLLLVVLATLILLGLDQLTYSWVLILSGLSGVAQAFGQPVRQALIPLLVPERLLMNAVALNALAMTTSMILSAPLVKIAGDLFDFEGVYGLQVVMLIVGLFYLRRLQTPPVTESPKRRLIQEAASALRHVVNDLRLRVLFLLLAVASISVNAAVMVTMQAKVKEELLRDSGDMAYLLGVMAVGIAITSVVVMRKGDMKRKGGKFQQAMMCGSALVICMGQASSFKVLLPLFFLMGLAGGFFITMNQGLIQSATPRELMGRVMGLYLLVQFGFMPIGALGLGWAASLAGPGNVVSVCGAVSLLIVSWTHFAFSTIRNLD
ncbi:MAG: MFS transporter [Actinomycetota bacterium]|nr:MFS transporter [Actinomycetota bacterium]